MKTWFHQFCLPITKVNNMNTFRVLVIAILIMSGSCYVYSASPSQEIYFIERVLDIYTNIPDGEQDEPAEKLLMEVKEYREDHPNEAEVWIASALARVYYAGDRSNLFRQRSLLKEARKELEKAIELNPRALDGFSQAFLGRLYGQLPPWPLSYGSRKKAEIYFKNALEINPNAKANNAYYGAFLISKDSYKEALEILNSATTLPPFHKHAPISNQALMDFIDKNIALAKEKME